MTSSSGVAPFAGILRLRAGSRYVSVDLPHLLVLLGIVAFCAWYLQDARDASTDTQNLLLIEPAAILGFIFAALILKDIVTISAAPAVLPPRQPLPPSTIAKVLGSMAMLGGYVAVIPYLGFDAATAAYVCGSLLVLGERRIVLLVVAPVLFAIVTTQLFKQVVPLPLPLLFG